MTFLQLQQRFPNDKAVIDYFIEMRYKGNPFCPHCASIAVYHRDDMPKVFQCMVCNNSFSVFKGTIFENSPTDLIKWMYAIHLFLNGKKGISGMQLMREVGVTYKTAWRMLNKIRVAMDDPATKDSFSGIIEIDETYIGGKPRKKNQGGNNPKNKTGRGTSKTAVVGAIDREKKKVHAKVVFPDKDGKKLTGNQLLKIIKQVAAPRSWIMTDEYAGYRNLSKTSYIHLTINHSERFADGKLHTNNIESFWSTLKRGIYGIYHHVSDKYLQSYVNEFCFRYSNRNNPNIFDLLLSKCIMK